MRPLSVFLVLFHFAALLSHQGLASDSTLISGLKDYILAESGYKTRDKFFNTWSEGGKPSVIVYVTSMHSVGTLGQGERSMIIQFGHDERHAKRVARKYDTLGYHTLLYKTYGTSLTELSPRFMSYSPEAKSFIVLHEFIHHYAMDRMLDLPLEYHEALADIMGNYGTIEFAGQSKNVSRSRAKAQRSRNERFYKAINKSIDKINHDSTKVEKVNARCQRRIGKILKDDLFQNDRFDYPVNNAYLFRYRYYTEKYFILKKALKQQRSIHGLLRIMEKAPSNLEDLEKYMKEL